MRILILVIGCLLAGSVNSFQEQASDNYYAQIQTGIDSNAAPALKKIENSAWNDFANPKSYEALSNAFSRTTEKVWSIVYAETYCNLVPDSAIARMLSKRIATQLQDSVSINDDSIAVSLAKSMQISEKRVAKGELPFETHYEASWAIAIVTSGADIPLSSLASLNKIRQSQLDIWIDKQLPRNQFINRLLAIKAAGHFEAYNYWLFAPAFPKEFTAWKAKNPQLHASWLKWLKENKYTITTNDFHRLTATTPSAP